MITEKINIKGIEYTVTAATYKMLQDAKANLIRSIERFEREHPSQPLPTKESKEEAPIAKKTAKKTK